MSSIFSDQFDRYLAARRGEFWRNPDGSFTVSSKFDDASDLQIYPIVPSPTEIGDRVIDGTYPLAVAKPPAPQGAVCTKCKGRNEYAEPSSSYVCYECR